MRAASSAHRGHTGEARKPISGLWVPHQYGVTDDGGRGGGAGGGAASCGDAVGRGGTGDGAAVRGDAATGTDVRGRRRASSSAQRRHSALSSQPISRLCARHQ
jgi:hypothetical protein